MRQRLFVFASLVAGFIACAETQDPAPSESSDAGGSAETGSKTDGASGNGDSSAPEDSGGGTDTGAKDSSTDAKAQDVVASDVNSTDTGTTETGSDAGTDAIVDAPYDVPDSGCPGATIEDPGCVVSGGNFASCATASATSTYFGYSASDVIDGDLMTSWYANSGACPSGTCPTTTIHVDVALNMPRTVGRVKLFGNRDGYPTGFDVLTARIELLNGVGNVVYGADVSTSRGNEPNGDVDHALGSPVSCVKTVRVIVKTGEEAAPGFGEVQAFAN